MSSLAEERIDDGGSHRKYAGPHDDLAPSASSMHAHSRDPGIAEIDGGCYGGRRRAIGGADWKLSKPFDAEHGYHLPGLVDRWPPWPRRTKAEHTQVSRLLTDPRCAIEDSSTA
jgi:hypothetical protein